MANLLMGTELSAQQRDVVNVAQTSGNALIALINDVLDLSKIEAKRMELETVPFNLRKEVDTVFALADEKLQQKELGVFMLVHEAVPTCVVGDPGRLREILVNLVSTSLKFTKEGSILVIVRVMDPHSEKEEGVPSSDDPIFIVSSVSRSPGSVQLSQVLPNASTARGSGRPGRRDPSVRRDPHWSRGHLSCWCRFCGPVACKLGKRVSACFWNASKAKKWVILSAGNLMRG